jgi:16S rRNA (cytosine1402-N4)-methyltransferase
VEQSAYHLPVLLNTSVEALVQNPNGTYVDVTFGGGGHSRAILNLLSPQGKLIAFDQDPDAKANLPEDARLLFLPTNFRFIENFLTLHGIRQVDGILADLGVSSHQFDVPDRGFTLRVNAPLDMRMNPAQTLNASTILQTYSEEDLARIFKYYGEFPHAKRLAERVVKERETGTIHTPEALKKLLHGLVHPTKLAKTLPVILQALRIEVNDEMGALEALLLASPQLIRKGGRLVVISYHSLEDRPVKHFIRSGNLEGKQEKDFFGHVIAPFKPVKMGAIAPDEEEVRINSRARSAKLRIAERL